ncbi:MAG: hypothetical protein H7Y19_05410 [Luteimonas sp.]|nr:hypothetical protein [Luteimonas sp.]
MLLFLGFLLSSPTLRASDRYQGVAHTLKGGALAYRETHWRYQVRGVPTRLVVYYCPSGAAFARKQVVDSPSAVAPNFMFVDGRDGYEEGVRTKAGGREVYSREQGDLRRQPRTIKIGSDAVIDAGFDALVRQRWDELLAGKKVSAAFLLPSRQDFIPVAIREQSPDRIHGVMRLHMRLDTWFGFAAPDTELVYRLSDRWLLSFQGIASVRDDSGRHQAVRIEFPDRLRANNVGQREINAAKAAPLAASCKG